MVPKNAEFDSVVNSVEKDAKRLTPKKLKSRELLHTCSKIKSILCIFGFKEFKNLNVIVLILSCICSENKFFKHIFMKVFKIFKYPTTINVLRDLLPFKTKNSLCVKHKWGGWLHDWIWDDLPRGLRPPHGSQALSTTGLPSRSQRQKPGKEFTHFICKCRHILNAVIKD
jgi:hypothetical protein